MLTELFLSAIAGGLFVAMLSAFALFYTQKPMSTKHISRDFILGTILTGCMYPLIPETFQEVSTAVTDSISLSSILPDSDQQVQIGPANF
jgi:hypothetical protein